MWWHGLESQLLRRLRQGVTEFKTFLAYTNQFRQQSKTLPQMTVS